MNIQKRNYEKYVSKLKKRLKNKSVSIISNNCIGGILYHDLGLRFNSPTINTLIYGDEFVEFAKNIKEYIDCELVCDEKGIEYPIGILAPTNKKIIHIHFLHNNTFEEAKSNWNRRRSRIDYNNLFFIYEHFNKFDDSIVKKFDKLNYHKVVFTHKKFNNIKSSKYIFACRKEKGFGTITKFKNKISGKRNIYTYDIVKQLNKIL